MNDYTEADYKDLIKKRDPKYDGRFYYGVKTTGIYCRPICPARPKPENIIIFKSSSEAEVASYRPCKRCSPDAAPGINNFRQEYSTIHKALTTIEEGNMSVAELANRLDVTPRHISRLFKEQLGVAPIDVINSHRLHTAAKLIQETEIPITDVAFDAGFKSVRRFNEAYQQLYKETPSEHRANTDKKPLNDFLSLRLSIRGAYDWGYMLAFIYKHPICGVEFVDGDTYTRYIVLAGDKVGKIEVSMHKNKKWLDLKATNIPLSKLNGVLSSLTKQLDLRHNPAFITAGVKYQDVRIPGAYEPFEVAVSIILGQLVSTQQAKAKLCDLVVKYGHKVRNTLDPGVDITLFPRPKDLMNAEIETIGITKAKAGAIRELAKLIDAGEIKLSYLEDIDIARQQLISIKGIGPWTLELIAMRCMGDPNAFPAKDLIIKRALDEKLVSIDGWQGNKAYLCHVIWRDLGATLTKKKVKN